MNPAIIVFNYASYIANPQFAIFSDPTDYPESLLQGYWNDAVNYMSDVGNFGSIQGTKREYAIQLMMSHLIFLNNLLMTGNGTGAAGGSSGGGAFQLQSATIDKVRVSVVPPPNKSQFSWWLNSTPFGQLLLALLSVNTVGGQYIGGSFVRAGFRGSDNGGGGWLL